MAPFPLGIMALAGAGGGATFELLESVTLSSPAGSVTFSGLDSYSDYKSLQIRMVTRLDTSGFATQYMNFNADEAANYTTHFVSGSSSSSTPSANTYLNEDYIRVSNTDRLTQSIADSFAPAVVDIYDFASTNKTTTVRVHEGRVGGDPTQSTNNAAIRSGLWNSTAAVTSISLNLPVAAYCNYVAGSRFSLIGVR